MTRRARRVPRVFYSRVQPDRCALAPACAVASRKYLRAQPHGGLFASIFKSCLPLNRTRLVRPWRCEGGYWISSSRFSKGDRADLLWMRRSARTGPQQVTRGKPCARKRLRTQIRKNCAEILASNEKSPTEIGRLGLSLGSHQSRNKGASE